MPITSLPNLLTLSRILAIPVVIATFYVPGDYARWFACALFSAAGVTDWLDGHMARRWEQQSEIGRFLDPIADKLLVSAILFMLTAFGRLSAEAFHRDLETVKTLAADDTSYRAQMLRANTIFHKDWLAANNTRHRMRLAQKSSEC